MNIQGQRYLRHQPFFFKQMVWQEKVAFKKSKKIITHSKWSKKILIESYNVNEDKITYLPNPASIKFVDRNQISNFRKIKNF